MEQEFICTVRKFEGVTLYHDWFSNIADFGLIILIVCY
ncbi:hypothetical protein K661_01594 [Piscirickettsia salmonis LF-89 = ATCC VR-1361]|nr:hypothetical protein K661_01594 [Piscirickettsia salmonis LF-89 = ATCC VR-1361]